MAKLDLRMVTLCAAASVNVEATVAALRVCLSKADFADCLLLTDAALAGDHVGIRIVPIRRLNSSRDYSQFILKGLVPHIGTPHCLIVQWDGFVLDVSKWDPAFLDFDYVGAPWPQFGDLHAVGNGGFSLRSRKLLEACSHSAFQVSHPEDLAICRVNRSWLERSFGIKFADRETAERFAFERTKPKTSTFGFHGIFNMIPVIGPDRFWDLYASLDDPSTAFVDYRTLISHLGRGPGALGRKVKMTAHWLRSLVMRRWGRT